MPTRIVVRKLVQIDFLSGPRRPHRRQGNNRAGVWVNPAQWVGVPALRAACVEQEIVKVPKNECVIAFGRPQSAAVGNIDLEKNLAIQQQSQKRDTGKAFLPTQMFDALRRGQHGNDGRDLWIANLEQSARQRRLQDHLVGAPSHIRKPRQDKNFGLAKLPHSRPVVGKLRFNHGQVLTALRAPEAVF